MTLPAEQLARSKAMVEDARRAKLERAERARAHDQGPAVVGAVDMSWRRDQLDRMTRAEGDIAGGKRLETRRAAQATMRAISRARAELQMRQEVAAGMAEMQQLEARRGVETEKIGECWLRFPRIGGQRDGLLALYRSGKLTAGHVMAGVVYRNLWTTAAVSLRCSAVEIVTASTGRPYAMLDVLAKAFEQRAMLADLRDLLTNMDEEGEALALVDFVARDGYSIRASGGGGVDRKANLGLLRRALGQLARRLEL